MRALMMSIFFVGVLLNAAVGLAGTRETISKVYASDDASICDKIDLNGLFKSRGGDGRLYELSMTKEGCVVKVQEKVFGSMGYVDYSSPLLKRELLDTNNWTFDLSGKQKLNIELGTTIPGGGANDEYVKSDTSISTRLVVEVSDITKTPESAYIEVLSEIKIPRNRLSPFDAYISVNGEITLSAENFKTLTRTTVAKVQNMRLENIRTRVLNIDSDAIPTAFSGWFAAGANYVLRFLDDVKTGPAVIQSLGFLERTENRIQPKELSK